MDRRQKLLKASDETGKKKTDNQHDDQRGPSDRIPQKGVVGADGGGFDLVEHRAFLSNPLCCSFVLIFETFCKELYENISEQTVRFRINRLKSHLKFPAQPTSISRIA